MIRMSWLDLCPDVLSLIFQSCQSVRDVLHMRLVTKQWSTVVGNDILEQFCREKTNTSILSDIFGPESKLRLSIEHFENDIPTNFVTGTWLTAPGFPVEYKSSLSQGGRVLTSFEWIERRSQDYLDSIKLVCLKNCPGQESPFFGVGPGWLLIYETDKLVAVADLLHIWGCGNYSREAFSLSPKDWDIVVRKNKKEVSKSEQGIGVSFFFRLINSALRTELSICLKYPCRRGPRLFVNDIEYGGLLCDYPKKLRVGESFWCGRRFFNRADHSSRFPLTRQAFLHDVPLQLSEGFRHELKKIEQNPNPVTWWDVSHRHDFQVFLALPPSTTSTVPKVSLDEGLCRVSSEHIKKQESEVHGFSIGKAIWVTHHYLLTPHPHHDLRLRFRIYNDTYVDDDLESLEKAPHPYHFQCAFFLEQLQLVDFWGQCVSEKGLYSFEPSVFWISSHRLVFRLYNCLTLVNMMVFDFSKHPILL